MRQAIKRWLFQLWRKDQQAVIVTIWSGPSDLAAAMQAEVLQLLPGYRHFAVSCEAIDAPEEVVVLRLIGRTSGDLRRQLRRYLRPYRVGLMPVLFSESEQPLRRAACLFAPGKVLAYNSRLERHHLRFRTAIASLLFLRGLPLDRIFLRPTWLFPWKRDRSQRPASSILRRGRSNRPGRSRVAILSPYRPYPLTHGGAVRMYALLQQAARDFDLYLLTFADPADEADWEPLQAFCTQIITFPLPRYREPLWSSARPPAVDEYWSPYVAKVLSHLRRAESIDLVQVEYTQLAAYRGDILVEHDITFDLYDQIRRRTRTFRAWWDFTRWHRFERRAVKRFRRVVTMSAKDQALLPQASTAVLPNGVDLERFSPEHEITGDDLLFVGSFRHFPNIAAFQFFTAEIWPLLVQQVPAARLTVVAGPDPELYWQQHTGEAAMPTDPAWKIRAYVEDVRPLYTRANLVVVPTTISAGTNLKVLEAMAMERAIVSTTSGCAGLNLQDRVHVWVADDAMNFAAAIVALLAHDQVRRELAAQARRFAEEHYGWRAIGARQHDIWWDLIHHAALRPATEADLPALQAIQQASPEAAHWDSADYLRYTCTVLEVKGAVRGLLVTRTVAAGEHEILHLAVAPDARRQGIARRLLRDLTTGTYFLEVRESNLAARQLYEKTGFSPTGRRRAYYDDPVEDAIVMHWQKW